MKVVRLAALTAASLLPAFAGYQYDFPGLLNPYSASQWTGNGTYSASNNMFTSSNANGGSLILNSTVPGPASSYEVRAKLTLTSSGGNYFIYLRASSNALAANGNTGTWYAVEMANPTFSGSSCSATLNVLKSVSGTVSNLSSSIVSCHNGQVLRCVMLHQAPASLIVYSDNVGWIGLGDSSITGGQPGIGVSSAPSGNGISAVDIGHLDTVPPNAVNSQLIGTSVFSNRVDLQWPGVLDDPNGIGVGNYSVVRDGNWLGWVSNTEYADSLAFSDTTVPANSTHTYQIVVTDYHDNQATTSFTVTTPPAGSVDAREVGIWPLGSYWGGGGEQIDMRSGNLNYTMPLLKALGRGGWGAGFSLNFNSQNWRQDPGGTWQLGRDIGYGHGWRLQAGSLTPVYSSAWTIDHCLFIDATGAEYRLNVNTNGVWSSTEGIYVYYDSNAGRLHFTDGSFWVMGSTSAGTEQDTGTMYPTLMEDSNGNQVSISYNAGLGVTWSNSSSRISTINDTRPGYPATYSFSYNTDAIPHLTGIQNGINTSENYTLQYTSGQLNSPFSPSTNYGSWAFLTSVTNRFRSPPRSPTTRPAPAN